MVKENARIFREKDMDSVLRKLRQSGIREMSTDYHVSALPRAQIKQFWVYSRIHSSLANRRARRCGYTVSVSVLP